MPKSASVIPDKVNSLLTNLQDTSRSIERQFENYETGDRARSSQRSFFNQLSFLFMGGGYDSDDYDGSGNLSHSYSSFFSSQNDRLRRISDVLLESRTGNNAADKKWKYLKGVMELTNMMAAFFKTSWELPEHCNESSHNVDSTAEQKNKQLIDLCLECWAKVVLDERCTGPMKATLEKSTQSMLLTSKPGYKPIVDACVKLLEVRWGSPKDPIAKLYSAKSLTKPQLQKIITEIEADPALMSEPRTFQRVRASMIQSNGGEKPSMM